MNEIMKYHGITQRGLIDYDEMTVTLRIYNTWIDTPMYKERFGTSNSEYYYIKINDVKIYIDDLYN